MADNPPTWQLARTCSPEHGTLGDTHVDSRKILGDLGFQIVSEGEDHYTVILPDGWTTQVDEYWRYIYDVNGKERMRQQVPSLTIF